MILIKHEPLIFHREKYFEQQIDFINSSENFTVFHSFHYAKIIFEVFNIKSLIVSAFENNKVCGVLILYLSPTFPTGYKYTDLIFSGSAGGILCRDKDIFDDMLLYLKDKFLLFKSKADSVELKLKKCDLNSNVTIKPVFQSFKLNLEKEEDIIWKSLDQKARNQIRKSYKSDLHFLISDKSNFDLFYGVYIKTIKSLGSPALPEKYFLEIIDKFPNHYNISIVFYNKVPISVMFNLLTDTNVCNVWAGSLVNYRHLCPNYMHYWEIIKWSKSNNFKFFDFGRSIIDSSHSKFKLQWTKQVEYLIYLDLLKEIHAKVIDSNSVIIKSLTNIWSFSPRHLTKLLDKFFVKRTG